jgi:hypothetical protein
VDGVRCGETDPAKLEVHHVRRVADGGPNYTLANLVTLCRLHQRLMEAA